MRVLVGWDDVEEAMLLELYLNVASTSAKVATTREEILEAVQVEPFPFDIVLLSVDLADRTDGFVVARTLKLAHPDCTLVVAAKMDEIRRLLAFLRIGIGATLPRDPAGDYIFLVHSTLEAALKGTRSAAERMAAQAMRLELESFRALQQAILPPNLSAINGYELAVRCDPLVLPGAAGPEISVGGDYYDATSQETGVTTFLVADATGHGLRASLPIVALDALLRTVPPARFRDPAKLLGDLNRLFCRQRLNRIGGGYVTAVCVAIDHRSGRVTWSTAGHPAPLMMQDGKADQLPLNSQPGPPLGVLEGADYPVAKTVLPINGRLLMFTDGLSEARAPGQAVKQFGAAGLMRIMAETQTVPPEAALERIFAAVDQFCDSLGRVDDATAILVERTGPA